MEALGRLYDLSIGFQITDAHAGAITGKRVSMKHASGLSAELIKAADNSQQDPVITVSYATAATGGSITGWPNPSASVIAATPQYFYKKAAVGTAAMTGAETWSKVAISPAAGVFTLTGEGSNNGIYVIPLNPTDPVTGLGTSAGGFPDYVEVDVGSIGSTQYMAMLFILHDLEVQEDPTRMFNAQT